MQLSANAKHEILVVNLLKIRLALNNKKAVAILVASVNNLVMQRNTSSKSNTIDCILAQPKLFGFRKTDSATKTADGNLICSNDRV